MSKYLTIRLPGSKDRITVTAPMLVSFFLNEAHGSNSRQHRGALAARPGPA
jgi:hypothetical protein